MKKMFFGESLSCFKTWQRFVSDHCGKVGLELKHVAEF